MTFEATTKCLFELVKQQRSDMRQRTRRFLRENVYVEDGLRE